MSIKSVSEQKIAALSGAIAAGAAIAALLGTVFAEFPASLDQPVTTAANAEMATQLRLQLEQIKRRQDELTAKQPVPEPISQLQRRLDQIEQRQERLERIIVEDPNKALELPLLRRDIEAVKENEEVSSEATRRSVEQVYDLSKWLIGAIALAVLSLAVNTFLRRKES